MSMLVGKKFKKHNIIFEQKPFFAFTLAEVLITLGIIGVVAALTIPTLIQEKAKQETASKFKKTYSTISQAVKLSEVDNGNNEDWDWGTSGDAVSLKNSLDTLWSPYLKIAKICTTSAECGYPSGTFAVNIQGANTYVLVSATTRTTAMLADGTIMVLFTNSSKIIICDINGGQGPNKYGKDIFLFVLDKNKGFVPYGHATSIATLNGNCSSAGVGDYCGAKLVRDGFQINSNYPW